MTSSPPVDRVFALADGRKLAYCEWGVLGGRPLVLLHGWQGSRLFCPDEGTTVDAGVRLITIDRPGFGRSDPRPDRSLLDWVDDYAELLSHLGIPRCPIVGWSGGGPYALACAFRMPDAVTRVALAASDGPFLEVPGALSELPQEARDLIRLLHRDPRAAVPAIRKRCQWYGDDWESMFDEVGAHGDDPDDRLMSRPEILEPMKVWMREGARQGAAGYTADWIAGCGPWGFSSSDVRRPVHVLWGEADRLVSRAHAEYLAATIPEATLRTYPGEGHLFPLNHWPEILAALLDESWA